MPTPQRWKAYTWEDVAVVLYDLVKGAAGTNVTIASLTALTAKVFHGDTLAQVSTTITFVIASTIFDTLQTVADDPRYGGSGGYNFRGTIPGTYFPDPDQMYIVEVYFTDTTANVYPDVWEIHARAVLGT